MVWKRGMSTKAEGQMDEYSASAALVPITRKNYVIKINICLSRICSATFETTSCLAWVSLHIFAAVQYRSLERYLCVIRRRSPTRKPLSICAQIRTEFQIWPQRCRQRPKLYSALWVRRRYSPHIKPSVSMTVLWYGSISRWLAWILKWIRLWRLRYILVILEWKLS